MARCIDCLSCYLDTPMSRWACEKGHIPVVYEDDEHCSTDGNGCMDFTDATSDENDPADPIDVFEEGRR